MLPADLLGEEALAAPARQMQQHTPLAGRQPVEEHPERPVQAGHDPVLPRRGQLPGLHGPPGEDVPRLRREVLREVRVPLRLGDDVLRHLVRHSPARGLEPAADVTEELHRRDPLEGHVVRELEEGPGGIREDIGGAGHCRSLTGAL